MTTIEWKSEVKGTGEYADVNGINLYYEIHGTRPAARPAPRRARLGRDVRAAVPGARRRPPGHRARPPGARPDRRHRPADRRPARWPTTSPR